MSRYPHGLVYSYNGYYIRLSAERQGFNSLIDRHIYAGVAQWQEAIVLGTIQCQFESDLRYHKEAGHRVLKRSPRKEPNNAVGNLGIGSCGCKLAVNGVVWDHALGVRLPLPAPVVKNWFGIYSQINF